MHAGKGRESEITAEAFNAALQALERSDVDGVCIFTLTDLLDLRETAKGRGMLAALRAFRA
jgi:hypothetical protein